MKNIDDEKIQNNELKNLFKYIKWIVLYVVFLTVFSIIFSKVYADGSYAVKNEIDLVSLNHNCVRYVLCSYKDIPVAFDLNDKNIITNLKYSVKYINEKSCNHSSVSIEELFKSKSFFPMNTKSKMKGLYTLENNLSYVVDINCNGQRLELAMNLFK